MSRADLYAGTKKWDKAKEDVDRVLNSKDYDSDIDLGWAYYKKGLCEVQLGDNKTAEKDLRKAVEFAQDSDLRQAIFTVLERISTQYDSSYERSSDSASSYF